MPKKKNPDATPSMKVMAAYWLLLFSGRPWTLTELSEKLQCSKQAVLRIMDHIDLSGYAPLQSWLNKNRQRCYQLMKPKKPPAVALSIEDIQTLLLCRDIAWNLLPDSLRETVSRAIGHATVLLPDFDQRNHLPDGIVCPQPTSGVDYREKGEVLACLMNAMQDNKVCELQYRAIEADKPVLRRVSPRRLLHHKDSLYLAGWLIKDQDTVYQTTMALQRIAEVKLTNEVYKQAWPSDEPQGFGVIKDEPFQVRAVFTPLAACYVSERIWSQDQILEPQPDGGVILTFSATSWPEVIAWALSFGTACTVLEPEKLREELGVIGAAVNKKYQGSDNKKGIVTC